MDGIEIQGVPMVVPTVCAPVEYVKTLTLSSNCIEMGKYGAIAGFLASIMLFIGFYWVGPQVYVYGQSRGWWS